MKRLLWAILIVALCALPPMTLATPDTALVRYLTSLPVVHDGRCNVDKLNVKNRECLILVDQERGLVFVILYTDELKMTDVLMKKGDEEILVWSQSSV